MKKSTLCGGTSVAHLLAPEAHLLTIAMALSVKRSFFNQQNISLLKTDRAPHAVPAWQGQAQARCNPGISPKGSQAARRRV